MFVSRPQVFHGENLLKSNVIMDPRIRGTANIVASNVCTITAHAADILSIAFSSTVLATCSSDKTVRLWQTTDFTELPCSPLTGHQYLINCCDFSPSGAILATCSTDGTLRLWNPKTGDVLAKLAHPSSCALRVCCFSPDGAMIVTGGDDDSACLWNVPEKRLIRCFKGHDESVAAATFTPDSNYFITGSSGGDLCGELLVWDAQFGHGKFLKRIPDCHDLGVLCCEFSPTFGTAGKPSASSPFGRFLLATGGKDNLVKLWFFDCEVGSVNLSVRLDTMLPGHTDSVLWLCFSPDGKFLASCSLDKTARLWNPETKQALISIHEHSSYVASCAFSVDSQCLATASNDCTVKIWQLTDTSQIMHNLNGYEEGESTTSAPKIGGLSQVAMETWSVDDVCTWLIALGLAEYTANFRAHAIDGKELLTLTDSDLMSVLAVGPLGHRNKILRERTAVRQTVISGKRTEQNSIPDEFLCPITHELMRDPVIASDGYTYDRQAIVSWITKEHRSPMTNVLLTSTEVTPNRTLKMMMQKFLNSA
ncbi:hypothetical protein BsWGS_25735 [Bradybaena similaris]